MLVATACPLADLISLEGLRKELGARASSKVADGESPMWFC